MDNAIKYAGNNLEISIQTLDENHSLILKISDNGIGMNKEIQKKIFDKFYRAQSGNIHDVKGFGIGLNYAKNILAKHNATIKVQSEINKGSTFTITFLLNKLSETLKILLVEDDKNFGLVLKDYLSLYHYSVCLCDDGEEGLTQFKKEQYDLCILDVMMPKKDGFTLASDIRKMDNTTPFIFLTAKSLKEDLLKEFKVGADDFIIKPFDSEVLLMKIKAISNRSKNYSRPTLQTYHIVSYTYNLRLRIIKNHQSEIKLSTKEGALLLLFIEHLNDILPRTKALRLIWKEDNYFTARSMDVYVAKLRKYLQDDPQITISNIHGNGYSLRVINP